VTFCCIVIDPAMLHGKPVIRGTRVPVSIVVGSLAGGMTFEDVQREYDLTSEDIRAALKFARRPHGGSVLPPAASHLIEHAISPGRELAARSGRGLREI